MGKLTTPLVMRDFRYGRYSPNNVGDFLCPENSVADCLNVNFDNILGHIQVRGGQRSIMVSATDTLSDTKIGTGANGVGAAIFSTATFLTFLAAISQTSVGDNTVIYYNDQTGDQKWYASDYVRHVASNDPVRFAQLNGTMFAVLNGVSMYESADGITWTNGGNCLPTSFKPTLVYRYQGRVIAAGDPNYPSRIYVSSLVDLSASPFITWNTDPVDGDWIDVNPDDGGKITGFAEASTFLLIFKNNGMYRTDDITNSVTSPVTPDNINNVGAASQELITVCQGVAYFYTGVDVRSTDGGYPQIISRSGIQDLVYPGSGGYIVPQSMGSDNINVWLAGSWDAGQLSVVKYSTRDQSWTVHEYSNYPIAIFTPIVSRDNYFSVLSALCVDIGSPTFNIYWMNLETGWTDGSYVFGEDIAQGFTYDYFAITQDIDFGSRAHQKSLSDKMIVFTLNGANSSLFIADSNGDYSYPVPANLQRPITILDDIQSSGFFFNFLWTGTSAADTAVFQGLEIEEITDEGVNYGGQPV